MLLNHIGGTSVGVLFLRFDKKRRHKNRRILQLALVPVYIFARYMFRSPNYNHRLHMVEHSY